MTIEESVPLRTLTTLRAGGPARFLVRCETDDEIRQALAEAASHAVSWSVIGGGSNLLASDDGYDGLLISPRHQDISFDERAGGVLIVAGAGVEWDALVKTAASRGLWGLENLAGIPGSVGASPVQNIGAYGTELERSVAFVEAIDGKTGALRRFSRDECAFGYRDSMFKREGGFVIVRVGFLLNRDGAANAAYADLARARESGADLSTPASVGSVVRSIRARKFPDLRTHGTAGSFFKNPVLPQSAYDALCARYPDLPGFAVAGGVKVPLAFVLDRVLGLKGFRMRDAWLFDAQPLVLVLDEGGTARDVDALALHVASLVRDATGISIEREVRSL